jgi:hypothetical protein
MEGNSLGGYSSVFPLSRDFHLLSRVFRPRQRWRSSRIRQPHTLFNVDTKDCQMQVAWNRNGRPGGASPESRPRRPFATAPEHGGPPICRHHPVPHATDSYTYRKAARRVGDGRGVGDGRSVGDGDERAQGADREAGKISYPATWICRSPQERHRSKERESPIQVKFTQAPPTAVFPMDRTRNRSVEITAMESTDRGERLAENCGPDGVSTRSL